MAETTEEEEEEIWEEEEEIWEEEEEEEEALAVWISPVHPFRAGILLIPSNSFGVSSGYPSRPKW